MNQIFSMIKELKIGSKKLWTGLISITGFISLGWFFFISPRFGSTYRVFQSASYGLIRQLSIVGFLAATFLILVWITYHWLKSFVEKSDDDSILPDWIKLGRNPVQDKVQIILISLIGWILLQLALSGQVENELDRLIIQLIQPLLIWGSFVCLVLLASLLKNRGSLRFEKGSLFGNALILSLIILSIGFILQLAGFGYTATDKINGNFDLTGYPLLGYQVLLACIPAGLLMLIIDFINGHSKLSSQKKQILIDIGLSIILFFTAFFSWRSFPIQKHVFYDNPRPPNYEIYPNSDANLYDRTALSLLTIGEFQTYTYRLDPYVGRRPFLILYQAGLHMIAGSNYADIISLQVGLFAILPVLIYLLTTSLFNRPAGLLAGLLTILREINGLKLSDTVTGVHSQLLMSEIPTMIGLVLFLLLLGKTARAKQNQGIWNLAAGGILGATMLIRQEVISFLPVISMGIMIMDRRSLVKRMSQILLITCGAILVISPWIIRNWSKSGELYLDLPGNRLGPIISLFSSTSDLYHNQNFSAEFSNKPQIDRKESTDILSKEIAENDFDGWLGHNLTIPPVVLQNERSDYPIPKIKAITNHFTSQLIESIVYLPSYPMMMDMDYLSKAYIGKIERYYGGYLYSPDSYVKTLPFWQTDWSGKIPQKSLLMVVGAVVLISLGVVGASRKDRLIALFPFLGYFGYISVYALFRRSGGRFLQEMDWVSMVYLSIGLVVVINKIFNVKIDWKKHDSLIVDNESIDSFTEIPIYIKHILMCVVLFGLGALPVIVEKKITNPYPVDHIESRTEYLFNNGILTEQVEAFDYLSSFIETGSNRTILGKAFYPRYFKPGEELVDIRYDVLGKLDQRYSVDRLEFYLIGSDTAWVVLPSFYGSASLPHGSEVMVVGCLQDGVMDALVVIQFDAHEKVEHVYWRDGEIQDKTSCPLSWVGQSNK